MLILFLHSAPHVHQPPRRQPFHISISFVSSLFAESKHKWHVLWQFQLNYPDYPSTPRTEAATQNGLPNLPALFRHQYSRSIQNIQTPKWSGLWSKHPTSRVLIADRKPDTGWTQAMAGQKFQYDESGGTFFYFLLSFLALILIPTTLYYWPRKKKEGEWEWSI